MKIIDFFSKVIDLINLNQMRYQVLEQNRFSLTLRIYSARLFSSWIFPEVITLSFNRATHLVTLKTGRKVIERPFSQTVACEIERNQQVWELVLWQQKTDDMYGARFLGERLRIARGGERGLNKLKACIERFWGEHPFAIIHSGNYGTWIAYHTDDVLEIHHESNRQPLFGPSTHFCDTAYVISRKRGELKVIRNESFFEETSSGVRAKLKTKSESYTYRLQDIESWMIERDDEGDECIVLKLYNQPPIEISPYLDYFPSSDTKEAQYGGYGPNKFVINKIKAFIEG